MKNNYNLNISSDNKMLEQTMTIIVNNKGYELSLAWIIAFWEGDGSLTITLKPASRNITGKQVMLIWEIHQHGVDKELLVAIAIFLNQFNTNSNEFNVNLSPISVEWNGLQGQTAKLGGLGSVEISNKKWSEENWMWRLRIDTQKDIFSKLLPILTLIKGETLLNKLSADLDIFIKACSIVQKGYHNTIKGNNYLSSLSQQLSNKLTFEQKSNLALVPDTLTATKVVGFTDAEGSFGFYQNHKTVRFEFTVTQIASESAFLKRLSIYFDAGVFLTGKGNKGSDNIPGYFLIRTQKDIESKVIPFFKENKLQTIKQYSFDRFCRAFEIYSDANLDKEQKLDLINKINLETENRRPIFKSS